MSTAEMSVGALGGLLQSILSDESYRPAEPRSLEHTGLPLSLIETLVLKYLLVVGSASGRGISDHICLPFGVLEPLLQSLRSRQVLSHTGSAPLNDYHYALTDLGRTRGQSFMETCGYVGPAPVPLADYVVSVDAQTIRAESPRREHLEQAFQEISIEAELFDQLGPAVNSGAGLFLYGAPGNGKTTLARRITACFGQHVWIPRTVVEDGQFIKFYDAAYHQTVEDDGSSLLKSTDHDRRWVKIRRPTVVVGGELTMNNLEIEHDSRTNVCEAPLQMKSNCGCLLIDDFGRQRIDPTELLNRWIVPLENRVDYLTLPTGKKFSVPFEQLIIFSTNLEPSDLTDEAFLRRIPYKIHVGDPSEAEFQRLFQTAVEAIGSTYRPDAVEYLLTNHYRPTCRPLRRCHPRDLVGQVRNFCTYHGLTVEMEPKYFDQVIRSYFTVVRGKDSPAEVESR
jgi:predicted ATPase with chaperone activity